MALHKSTKKYPPPERVEVAKNSKALCCKVPDLGLLDGFSTPTVMDFVLLDLFFLAERAAFFVILCSAAAGTEHGWSLPQVTVRARSQLSAG